MNRRELLKSIALLTGASVVGGEFLLSGCKNPAAGQQKFSAYYRGSGQQSDRF
jgi:hypothetical protein